MAGGGDPREGGCAGEGSGVGEAVEAQSYSVVVAHATMGADAAGVVRAAWIHSSVPVVRMLGAGH